jgi:23S rRNA (guanosine2251-2'-O)-methyltransferase
VQRLLVRRGREPGEVEHEAARAGVAIEVVDRELLDDLVGEGIARGVLAIARPPRRHDPLELVELARTRSPTPSERRLIVALDGLQDPHNLGAIVRSAEFFGVAGLLWSEDRSAALSPAAVRASAGASERVALAPVTNLARALEELKDAGWWLVGTVVDGGEPLHELARPGRLPDDLVVVMGGEEKGLRRLTRDRCDFLATIPRVGSLGSLNVSAAAAVTLAALAFPAAAPSQAGR